MAIVAGLLRRRFIMVAWAWVDKLFLITSFISLPISIPCMILITLLHCLMNENSLLGRIFDFLLGLGMFFLAPIFWISFESCDRCNARPIEYIQVAPDSVYGSNGATGGIRKCDRCGHINYSKIFEWERRNLLILTKKFNPLNPGWIFSVPKDSML